MTRREFTDEEYAIALRLIGKEIGQALDMSSERAPLGPMYETKRWLTEQRRKHNERQA